MTVDIKGPVVDDETGLFYEWFGLSYTSPKKLDEAMKDIGDEDITLEINSPGGLCNAAFEICEKLNSCKNKVTANVIFAASAASLIACAADETLMADASIMMIHNTRSVAEGDYRDMTKEARVLKEYNKALINIYMRKTGKTADELQKMLDKDTWMSPQEAIDNGFANGWIHGEPEQAQIQVAASEDGIIPKDKIDKFLSLLRSEKSLMDDDAVLRGASKTENGGNAFLNINTNEKNGGSDMTLEEFLADNPEAQAELDEKVNAGVDAAIEEIVVAAKEEGAADENRRLKELDEIANSVTEQALAEAKYGEKKMDAKDLAYETMKNEQINRANYMKDAMDDAATADEVGTEPVEDEQPKDGAFMAQYINSKKEGK